jgi:hypothetical protein
VDFTSWTRTGKSLKATFRAAQGRVADEAAVATARRADDVGSENSELVDKLDVPLLELSAHSRWIAVIRRTVAHEGLQPRMPSTGGRFSQLGGFAGTTLL